MCRVHNAFREAIRPRDWSAIVPPGDDRGRSAVALDVAAVPDDRSPVRLYSTVFALLIAAACCLPLPAAARNTFAPDTSPPAAASCPADIVVWVNTRSGVYHLSGMTWFGHTREGRYMCRTEADKAGYRATRNGQ